MLAKEKPNGIELSRAAEGGVGSSELLGRGFVIRRLHLEGWNQ